MKETYEFLKKCGVFYIATIDGDQPRVRPFGVINIFEDKLYIQTGKVKKVSKQMEANNKVEITSSIDGVWIRIEAKVVRDERRKVKEYILNENPIIKGMYSADDDNMEVLYLKDVTATINSFSASPVVYKF